MITKMIKTIKLSAFPLSSVEGYKLSYYYIAARTADWQKQIRSCNHTARQKNAPILFLQQLFPKGILYWKLL